MIHNPPHITSILRAWNAMPNKDAQSLAALLTTYLGPLPWDVFLQTYRLHLQSIPMPIAREAWGLTQTKKQTATQS